MANNHVFSFFGFALSFFIRIRSQMFLNSLRVFVSRTSMLLDVNVTCVSSACTLYCQSIVVQKCKEDPLPLNLERLKGSF